MAESLRTIWAIFRDDLRRATSSVMAVIVLLGLVALPSLFTWFNVIASWDPFGSTSRLTVAVANTDEGYESDLIPVRINLGDQVVSALRANDDLDWTFTDEQDAVDGTLSGEYYAALVLPADFSRTMLTFYVEGTEPAQIAYYTNEKKNALAPKITGQGADEVSATINEAFTQTLGELALGIVDGLADRLDAPETQAALTRVQARLDTASSGLDQAAATATMLTAMVTAAQPVVQSAGDLVAASASAFGDAGSAIRSGVDAAGTLAATITTAADAVVAALDASATGYAALADRVDDLYAALETQTSAEVAVLDDLAARAQAQIDAYQVLRDALVEQVQPLLPASAQPAFDEVLAGLDEAIAQQTAVHDRLSAAAAEAAAGDADAQASHAAIAQDLEAAQAAIAAAKQDYAARIRPQLDELGASLTAVATSIASVAQRLDGAVTALSGGTGSIEAALAAAAATTSALAADLAAAGDSVDAVGEALAEALDSGDASVLADAIGADPSLLAASLAQPVGLERTVVYPVTSFGAAMAPLYTMLALWVGALLASVTIRVDVARPSGAPGREPALHEQYLGRYGIFWLIGFLQATLLGIGNVLFVQLEPAHPVLLVLAGWVASFVFTLTIYTLVVAFGNAGKAIAVLLLVVQISSSGGAYPLQLLPEWFQAVSPFLPAAHAIAALRAAIAGVYGADYWVSLGWLLAFAVPALVLGLWLRRPLVRGNRRLLAALASTKLM